MQFKPSSPGNILLHLTELFSNQNVLLEDSNPVQFEYKFTGTNHETLPWIFAAEKYLRVNGFTLPKLRFRRIFASMHNSYQNRYLLDTESDADSLTFEKLKAWVLKEYPPPKTKYEFKLNLKSMLMYKNEDPNIAYSRFKYKLAQINKAIATINEGIKAESTFLYPDNAEEANKYFKTTKMFNVSIEDKREALTRMFVIRNNKSEWNNDGVINGLVRKFLLKKDPRTMADWAVAFQHMKTQLIPRILDGQKEYEYVSYPENPDDDTIYTKRHHQPKTPNQPTPTKPLKVGKPNRKRQRDTKTPYKQPPSKKQRQITCTRCHRQGHHFKECWAEYDVNRNPIKSPPKATKPGLPSNSNCTICGRQGHTARACYHKEKFKNKKCTNCGRYGHTKRACFRTKNTNDKTFTPYSPSNKHPKQTNEPEINVMSKSNQATINAFKQWANNNPDMNETMRQDLQSFADSLASSCPRK